MTGSWRGRQRPCLRCGAVAWLRSGLCALCRRWAEPRGLLEHYADVVAASSKLDLSAMPPLVGKVRLCVAIMGLGEVAEALGEPRERVRRWLERGEVPQRAELAVLRVHGELVLWRPDPGTIAPAADRAWTTRSGLEIFPEDPDT